MPLDAAHRDAAFDVAALDAAIDAAFAEPEGGGRNTLAVVVLHDGRLVAERYADGITPATPLHGWSMTKSLAATLAGAMVQRGEIALDVQAITDEAALEKTPEKADITLEHLLRMTAGLDITEDNDGTDPNSDMLFTEGDMATWAARRERLFAPGEHWEYMSGQTVLATARMQEEIEGGLIDDLAGVRDRVFEPLDMGSAIFETDQAGNLQGSSYMYAAAQDWARMGQLYLDDGLAPDGTRILPADWDEIVATPTDGSNAAYGLGFWLGHPRDQALDTGYYMSGFQGQFGYVLPEQNLVVVRMGATNFTSDGGYDLASAVAAALRPAPAPEPETPPVEEAPGPEVPEDGSPQ
jgi:CubicO group peptidase (beta-lactamase class C family)